MPLFTPPPPFFIYKIVAQDLALNTNQIALGLVRLIGLAHSFLKGNARLRML